MSMEHDTVIEDTRNWLVKAVIGLNLCPFAKGVHVKNQVRYRVSDASTPEGLLEELGAQLDRYDASVEQSNRRSRAHVEATAELDDVGAQITALLKQLDGMNQFRFRNDPEKLAGWESARNVPWPVPASRGPEGEQRAAAPAA